MWLIKVVYNDEIAVRRLQRYLALKYLTNHWLYCCSNSLPFSSFWQLQLVLHIFLSKRTESSLPARVIIILFPQYKKTYGPYQRWLDVMHNYAIYPLKAWIKHLAPKIFHVVASRLFGVTIEILSNLLYFSIIKYAGACWNFCQFDKISLRICV